MALESAAKKVVFQKYRKHESDTGCPQVQIALLTTRLNQLSEHFKTHTKDHASRRGLMKLVGKRRRLLDFLHRKNPEEYRTLISELGIRK